MTITRFTTPHTSAKIIPLHEANDPGAALRILKYMPDLVAVKQQRCLNVHYNLLVLKLFLSW